MAAVKTILSARIGFSGPSGGGATVYITEIDSAGPGALHVFPVDGQGDPLLLDPSVDEPTQHLVLTPTTGLLACGAKGPESIRVFGLNDDTRRLPTGRSQALIGLAALLERYDRTWAHDPVRRRKCAQPE